MDFKDVNEIIQFAIEKEKEAAEFYDSCSEKEKFTGVKEMLREFADEERKHKELLENMDQAEISEYKLEWVTDIKRSNVVVEMEYHPGMEYRDILLLAMKREEKALELYNYLLREAQTENQKKVFKILCQEEAKHKNKLETLYDDFMAEMGD